MRQWQGFLGLFVLARNLVVWVICPKFDLMTVHPNTEQASSLYAEQDVLTLIPFQLPGDQPNGPKREDEISQEAFVAKEEV